MLSRVFPRTFMDDEDGGVLVFGAILLVAFFGLVSLIFDMGRMANTQTELQSYADSVALAAAAELDGKADSITRAQAAAASLISDTQTYADGAKTLDPAEVLTLTFYTPDDDGDFSRLSSLETTNGRLARFVTADIADHTVAPGLGAAFIAMRGGEDLRSTVAANATAGFALQACNVAPVAACLPTVDFEAEASIGDTLRLQTALNVGQLLPGQIAAVDTVTNLLDGLEICAGLFGSSLEACLLAARQPETACMGPGGLQISADVNGNDLLDALNTRFDLFKGIASPFANDSDFSGAPNVLTGLTNALGICLPIDLGGLLGSGEDIGLPADDCFEAGTCGVQGDGSWSLGRQAYIDAHYDGTDPYPNAQTRFEFYQAEINASVNFEPVLDLGGLLGGGAAPQACAPQQNLDPNRRLMVVAGIDCNSASVDVNASTAPVQQFFEVFALGPGENGALEVEITACLGGDCGGGNLGTDVRDIVRLVE
ncbi:MAG: TadE/TadG family type IV pilus assembly protein [Maritimibacter sp.]